MSETMFTAEGDVSPLVFSVNPRYPGKVGLHSGIAKGTSEGGDEYAYTKGKAHVLYVLIFDGLPASEFDGGFDYPTRTQAPGTQSLVNWFLNVAPYGVFTYHDPFGKEHTVRIINEALDFSLTEHDFYSGSITLKETLG